MTEIDTLYAVLRSGHPICMVGTSDRAFHTFMRARARGIRGVLILCSCQPHVIRPDTYEPPYARGIFQMGSDVLLCDPNEITILPAEGSEKMELIVAEYTLLGQPKMRSGRRFRIGHVVGGGGFEFIHVDDALANVRCNDSWYDALDAICADKDARLEKFRPLNTVSYYPLMVSTMIVVAIDIYPGVLATHYSIPLGYVASGLSFFEFARSVFFFWMTVLNAELAGNTHWNIGMGLVAGTMYILMGQLRFESEGEFAYPGLFAPCMITAMSGIGMNILCAYAYDPTKLTRAQLQWTLALVTTPFLWGILLLLCALARLIGSTSGVAGSIFISFGFAVMETLAVKLFDYLYHNLVERSYANADSTRVVGGNQKKTMA